MSRMDRVDSGWPISVVALAAIGLLAGCHDRTPAQAADISRVGAMIIARQACGSCHVIPGIEGADGQVGPPLTHFASRQTVAGKLPNTPDELVRFLRSPKAIMPGGAMPDLNLTNVEAREVAAYLYRLK
jgi:cytochrome c2